MGALPLLEFAAVLCTGSTGDCNAWRRGPSANNFHNLHTVSPNIRVDDNDPSSVRVDDNNSFNFLISSILSLSLQCNTSSAASNHAPKIIQLVPVPETSCQVFASYKI